MTYLGIDLGTSEVKVALVDDDQHILAGAAIALTVSHPHPNWSEQDPQDWWQATLQGIDKVRAAAGVRFLELRGIGLSGQMHGACLLDKRRQVLRPAMLWNDTRAADECAALEAAVPESRAVTGNLAMPGFTAPKLLWLRKNEPEIFERIDKVLLPKDYIAFRLTGAFFSDLSDASGTLWLDVRQRRWSDRMLAATGLERAQMPQLIEGSQAGGRLQETLRRDWGLKQPVAVAGGGGDNAASAAGIGAIAPGDAFLSLGTSGVLFVCSNGFAPAPAQAVHAFCHCLPQRWHQMSVILSAGSCLAWAAGMTQTGNTGQLAQLATTAAPASAPIFLPYLNGERTPHNNANAQGVFFGLRSSTDRAAIAYSVLEGVAFAMTDGYQALRATGSIIERASFVGGGSRSAYWGRLIASATGITLLRHPNSEVGGVFGAARLARLAVTGESIESVCVAPPVTEEIRPESALCAILPPRLARFRRLYDALKFEYEQ
jgi:xylulokinase